MVHFILECFGHIANLHTHAWDPIDMHTTSLTNYILTISVYHEIKYDF